MNEKVKVTLENDIRTNLFACVSISVALKHGACWM